MKNVIAIVSDAIEAAGGDGLCSDECGCQIGDLVPCGEDFSNCVIARRRIAEQDEGDLKAGDYIMFPLSE